jgi:hypothetical protein
MPHIFISYGSKDRALVDALAGAIDAMLDDVVIWYDRELNRAGGHQWWALICEEIRQCDIFIYALSTHVLASEPCKREYGYARVLGKPILPVMIADIDIRYLPRELQATQLVNFQQGSFEQQKSLRLSIRNLPPAPELPADAQELAPEAPLDPVGVLLDRITNLTSDPQAQALLIIEIDDLQEDVVYGKFIPDVLANLVRRDDVLTVRNLRRAQELLGRLGLPAAPVAPPQPHLPASPQLLPAPFAWIDIPGTLGKTWQGAPYKIAKYPVTNAQFKLFVDAKGYTERRWWTEAGWEARAKGWVYDNGWKETGKAWTEPRYWRDKQWNGAEQPVVGVSWYEAVAYCLWLSEMTGEQIMLPTEDQWQYAAQSDDGRTYPWGNDWDCKKCNNSVSPCDSSVTTPVRQFEGKGESFFKVVDMAGNAWEWCLTDYDTQTNDVNSLAERRCLRGGSWFYVNTDFFRCVYRFWDAPLGWNYDWGFRLALS